MRRQCGRVDEAAMQFLTGAARSIAGNEQGVSSNARILVSMDELNNEYLTHEDQNPGMEAWSKRLAAQSKHVQGFETLATRPWPVAND